MKRFLIPFVALVASGLLGGVAAVGVWEAVDDDAPATRTVSASPTSARTTSAVGGLSIGDIYDQASPGVVEIRVEARGGDVTPEVVPSDPNNPPGLPRPGSTGTGFVIDEEGRIVTNQHVVGDAETVQRRSSRTARRREARVRRHRPVDGHRAARRWSDAGPTALEPLALGPSDALEIGDAGRRDRQPARPRGTVTPASSAPSTASSRRRTASPSTARSRPTPRSTAATRAARCSTRRGEWSA